MDEQKIREAAARLEDLEQKGATLDDILNGPEGYVWIEEFPPEGTRFCPACGGLTMTSLGWLES